MESTDRMDIFILRTYLKRRLLFICTDRCSIRIIKFSVTTIHVHRNARNGVTADNGAYVDTVLSLKVADLKISRSLTHLMRNILQLTNAALWAILDGLTKKKCGQGSSVGIATNYGLDGPGIESRWGEIFCTCPDRPWGPPSLLQFDNMTSVGVEGAENRRKNPGKWTNFSILMCIHTGSEFHPNSYLVGNKMYLTAVRAG
jgi:hypothetical protein